ncbi:hypothetical protein EHQ94_14185 [Leptospira meyeri]|uniref:hypothetical protein n=1 Tax=Leptospira meyeri TaxID=29508 RepID=UPI0010842CF8|nr:hypothetical protein [Leptospira meyeri]TGM63787.1 hypothetical protein EHQ94_14185 [Leptospira meyeri]TGM67743.1 hypothetical protein EHQ93_07165 [Leptospira meyeri]
MNIRKTLSNHKPLFYSIVFGLFYFTFATGMNLTKTIKYLFIDTMFFLPGFTFPISTSYFDTNKVSFLRKCFHLILSMTIYYLVVHIFLYENRIDYITIVAGFLGSFFYLLNNKFVLKQQMKIKQILFIAILSSIAFLPFEIIQRTSKEIFIGFGLFYWTVLNGGFLNFLNRRNFVE